MSNLSIKIVHLYPEEMNIYGDMGNIITLKKRAEWRDIDVEVDQIDLINKDKYPEGDLYFMGGGQDNDQFKVFEDLLNNKRDFIKNEVEANKVFLLICGAFQLFGEYFLDAQGREIKGLDLLPIKTKAPGDALADRCLGNLVTEVTAEINTEIHEKYPGNPKKTIVGFENHGGQTFFSNKNIKPIANVISGKGNNAKQGIEGARIANMFGSYTHGSLLPKNPHIADMLLTIALETKYGEKISLEPLDDTVEWQAHTVAKSKVLES